MSPCSKSRQRGDVLLEALVGVLITAIIGAGMVQVAGRIVANQYQSAVDALVVNELRNDLQIGGVDLCDDDAPLTGSASKQGLPKALQDEITLSRTACIAPVEQAVQIGGVTFNGIMPSIVKLTAQKGDEQVLEVSSVVPAMESAEKRPVTQ